jgi:type II secretory pathway component GspD/PulD (secretin)
MAKSLFGMLSILGRLFSAPNQTSSQSDIVITIRPHIVRSVEITPEDHLAHLAGTQQSGLTQSIEDVIFRAQAAEEQERPSIAQQPSTPPSGPIIEASIKSPQ